MAEVRTQIRQLKEEEEGLRDSILAGECTLVGDEYRAQITTSTQERLDIPKLKAELGLKVLRPFLRALQVEFVRVKSRDDA